MFAEHQPQLAKLGRHSADGFERVATFVLLTIRMPLREACLDYKALRTGADRVKSLFGSKHAGLAHIREHAAEILERLEYVYETAESDDDAADAMLAIVMEIPGIGLAKGGFILQILYGISGCIDTHNLTRFELTETTFKLRKDALPRTQSKLRRKYNEFCHRIGTATLWDDWCAFMAANDPVNYHNPEFVSSLHLVPLEC